MWPPAVEDVAAFFRGAGAEARLEQLPEAEAVYPGSGVQTLAVDCGGRLVVALLPHDRELDTQRLASVVGTDTARIVEPPPFPYRSAARILIERVLLGMPTVWIKA